MEIVSFEIAKKLKEKGFNKVCYYYYEPLRHRLNRLNTLWTNKECESCGVITAPTISQVLKWLREEKKIYILIDLRMDLSWFYEIWGIEISLYPLGCAPYQKHQSYELAALAGIEYVIDNLI